MLEDLEQWALVVVARLFRRAGGAKGLYCRTFIDSCFSGVTITRAEHRSCEAAARSAIKLRILRSLRLTPKDLSACMDIQKASILWVIITLSIDNSDGTDL